MTKFILGIDPGMSGAVALYGQSADGSQYLKVWDMPTRVVRKSGKMRPEVDEGALADLIWPFAPAVTHAYVEFVASMPGQGVASSFKFGKSYGMLLGILAACEISRCDVTPKIWKGALGVSNDKTHARIRATILFPEHYQLWPLEKHDGRAEASLIAYYGWRKEHG